MAVSTRVYLGELCFSLMHDGHEVRVHAADPPDQRAFGDIIRVIRLAQLVAAVSLTGAGLMALERLFNYPVP